MNDTEMTDLFLEANFGEADKALQNFVKELTKGKKKITHKVLMEELNELHGRAVKLAETIKLQRLEAEKELLT